MRRFPLRARLAVTFATALVLTLVLLGTLLYIRVGNALDEQIDDGLEQQSAAIGDELPQSVGDDGFVAVAGNRVTVDGAAFAPEALAAGRSRPTFATMGEYRVLLRPWRDGEVLAIGRSLDDRDDALASLLTELLVVGGLALVLFAVGGYVVAVSAARPVLERLERGLERERQFVSDASHELRTPLTTLRAELELALRRERSRAELERALRSAEDEVDRLVRLAEDLLVLARADEGRLELRREPVQVRDLVDAVERRFSTRAAEAGRPLEARSDGTKLVGDRLRLEQALGNLVDNALRHGAGAIIVEGHRVDASVDLSVRDEGGGIPRDLAPRAFERFTRADGARTGDGSGLGLAIVDAIARAHEGVAYVDNGAVTLRVPLQSTVK